MALFKKRSSDSHRDADTRTRGHHAPAPEGRTMSLDDAVAPTDPAREQVKLLKRELAEAHAQLDLYQFQIKSLRKDMEQLKMEAVLGGLGGYPLSAVNPEGDKNEEPGAPDTDPETVFALGEDHAHAQIEAARQPQEPPPDAAALQHNLLAALKTVSQLDAEAQTLRNTLQNRDIQIELLNDKIEIEQQKIRDNYVPVDKFESLVREAEIMDAERRALADRIKQYENVAQSLSELRAERGAAEDRAESLHMELEDARHRTDVMRERYETFKTESMRREEQAADAQRSELRRMRTLEQQNTRLQDELEHARTQTAEQEKRVARNAERMRGDYQQMQELIKDHDRAMAELREKAESLKRDNAVLKERNRKLAAHVKAAHKQATADSAAVSDETRKELIARFGKQPSSDTLMELRSLFLGTRAYQEAVRTFRQLLVDPRNQKFMPAICLLVGEFYKLAGRQEEASFYLANPLIRDDPFAREIISRIKKSQAAKQAPAPEAGQ